MVERCKICGDILGDENFGETGFCICCLSELRSRNIEPQEALPRLKQQRLSMNKDQSLKWLEGQRAESAKGRPPGRKPGKKGMVQARPSSSGGKPVRWRQKQVDALYQKHLECLRLRIAVQANESGGFGDLINCLNTSQILTGPKNKWWAYASCNHDSFDQMLKGFPKVRALTMDIGQIAEDPSWVLLDVVSKGGTVTAGAIDEYGFQEESKAQDVYSRGAGLAPHEIGIMINPALREPLPLKDLRLAFSGLQHLLTLAAQDSSHRLFFGYGAGKKTPDCFDVLLDRVLFDESIRNATVLPVGHGAGHLEGYWNNRDRWRVLAPEEDLEKWKSRITREKFSECVSLKLPIENRSIQLLFPQKALDYADMLKLWRAADRSFTISEGDQSFSEAISAGIPMAYQLWKSGEKQTDRPHKTRLFEDLLKCCRAKPNVESFLRDCKNYCQTKFNHEAVMSLIARCNDKLFCEEYKACMLEIAENHDIAHALPGFVKRLWLRKVRALQVAPTLQPLLDELFELEDQQGSLNKIETLLLQLRVSIKSLAANLTWKPDACLGSLDRRPSDINYQVASALASIDSILKKGS